MPRISPAPQSFERRVPGIEYGVLDDLVGYALRRAQIAIYIDFEAALGPYEMTPQRFSTMVVIAENEGITQRDLGQVLGIARSGVVQVVNGLASRSWVSREAHGTDARAWLLKLTPAGRTHLADVKRRVRAHDQRVSKRLSAVERVKLIALLDRLGPG
jgi:DNA-binding MarR family transcriptional regulator